ncbi:hypothetical protein EVAR_82426_1 [Eumeta japonica]|uniref:Uncharacterized protein n=1 Tax=Eumeta variegata TaxID=151549 RepID=A0A4C1YG12_EUMVA|nr:hypothetical protein EVAR_82426_1 [Eumeta japonica]
MELKRTKSENERAERAGLGLRWAARAVGCGTDEALQLVRASDKGFSFSVKMFVKCRVSALKVNRISSARCFGEQRRGRGRARPRAYVTSATARVRTLASP